MTTESITWRIPNMDCAAEESEIRHALRDVAGVQRLAFRLGARELRVDAAPGPLTDVAQRFGEMTARAGDATSGRWDRLGGIFEDRVAQALLKLGTPTAEDWSQVLQRLEALEKSTPTSPPPQRAEKQPAARRTKAAR